MSNSKSPKTLSKSRFKLALECPAKLYYYGKPKEYTNQKQENAFLAALAEGGFQVGELAKYYNPCCKNMPACDHEIKSTGYHESIEETSKYINMEKVILYEPVIHFENFSSLKKLLLAEDHCHLQFQNYNFCCIEIIL